MLDTDNNEDDMSTRIEVMNAQLELSIKDLYATKLTVQTLENKVAFLMGEQFPHQQSRKAARYRFDETSPAPSSQMPSSASPHPQVKRRDDLLG